ncbi:hypothetical protein TNIN_427821 [Trichonephila inaurata madagascariensis]|uniref:Uncharacterized protein n=1 Tax=Trichonephila inaurata madagascariensis TaxID=2747483 RepID=A0A8X7CB25_9ARAC|nr:hypothetical protein TNIN_427821 [Trichonephila inaurata madagascariensis]
MNVKFDCITSRILCLNKIPIRKTRILRLTTLWRWKLCLKPQQRLSDLPSPSRVIKMNRRSLFTVVTFEEGSPASGFLPAGKHFLHCHLASDE